MTNKLYVPAITEGTNHLKKVVSDPKRKDTPDPFGIGARAKKAEEKGTTLFQEAGRLRDPVGALFTGLDAFAEGGMAGAQALTPIGVRTEGFLPIPLSMPFSNEERDKESRDRSYASRRDIASAFKGDKSVSQVITDLAERMRSRPIAEQLAAGFIFDPLNFVPGLGVSTDMISAVKLLATRGVRTSQLVGAKALFKASTVAGGVQPLEDAGFALARSVFPDLQKVAGGAGDSAFILPKDLMKASPRYSSHQLTWDSDVDKALYIVGNPKSKSAADPKFMDWLRGILPGKTDDEIRAAGRGVRNIIKDAATNAPDDISTINIPNTGAYDNLVPPKKVVEQAIPVPPVPPLPPVSQVSPVVAPVNTRPSRFGPEVPNQEGMDEAFRLSPIGQGVRNIDQAPARTEALGEAAEEVVTYGLEESTEAIDEAIRFATAIYKNDAEGLINRGINRLGQFGRQLQSAILPRNDMSPNISIAWIAQGNVLGSVGAKLSNELAPVLENLRATFGADLVNGKKKNLDIFIGTAEEAKYPWTGYLYDILQNPALYRLTPNQRSIIIDSNQKLTKVFREVRADYDLAIGDFTPNTNSMFLSNIDRPKEPWSLFKKQDLSNPFAKSARAKTRESDTGREHWKVDSEYTPVVNVETLIGVDMHGGIAKLAGERVFAIQAGGLSKSEALILEGHKPLVTARDSLLALISRVTTRRDQHQNIVNDAVDAFVKSDLTSEQARKGNIQTLLDVVRDANKLGTLDEQAIALTSAKAELAKYAKVWKDANPKGYQQVQQGSLNKWFSKADAEHVNRLAEVSDNPMLRLLDNIRATAFGGDMSPLANQGVTALLADPIGVTRDVIKMFKQNKRFWREDALVEDVALDPKGWELFSKLTGLNPLSGVDKEFGTGFIGMIPKIGKHWAAFNETIYRPLMRQSKNIFDSSRKGAIKAGFSHEEALAIAADDASKMIPRINTRRFGWSQREAARYRSITTSISFLTQPASVINNATKALFKMGTKKTISRSERFAVQRVVTLIATSQILAISSSVSYALTHNQDPMKAVRNVLDPNNSHFMAITTPWGARLPMGGPYRSIMRAIVPGEVAGSPIPLPFAGLLRFANSKAGPGLAIARDLGYNKDFYGRAIMTGDFPVNILQGLEYAVTGVAPLTAGSTTRVLREGEGALAAFEEGLSQFGGSSYQRFNAIHDARKRWADDLKEYNDIETNVKKIAPGEQTGLEYRDRNPEVDAKLFITGKTSSFRTRKAMEIAIDLIKENDIPVKKITGVIRRKDDIKLLEDSGRKIRETYVDKLISYIEKQNARKKSSGSDSINAPATVDPAIRQAIKDARKQNK
jgi:hypothetical protein